MLCLPGSSDMLWGSSGHSPLCLGLSLSLCTTCPSSYIKETRESKERKRSWKRLILYCSLLSPHHLWGRLWKKNRYSTDWSAILGQSSYPYSKTLMEENRPSCSCLPGQSALSVPWVLNTRFIKVMLLFRGAMEMSQSLFFLSEIWPTDLITGIFILEIYPGTIYPGNIYIIYPGNKEKAVHIRSYNQCCLEQVSLSFLYLFQKISALFTPVLCSEG